jgi:hypothetical protein
MDSYAQASNSYIHEELKQRAEAIARASHLFETSAQRFAEGLNADFASSVLIRIYLTCPFKRLHPIEEEFAKQAAKSAGVEDQLRDDTQVLCLMGTKGRRPQWGDRRQSKGHLAIPLVSSKFVQRIPMIARLLKEFGIGTDWLDVGDKTSLIARSLGRLATVFYVPDAATFRDHANRLVIPAQDFVTENRVKTVFGVGGAYVNGYICAILCFVSESLDRSVAERFLPIINFYKHATASMVTSGRLFA